MTKNPSCARAAFPRAHPRQEGGGGRRERNAVWNWLSTQRYIGMDTVCMANWGPVERERQDLCTIFDYQGLFDAK